MSKLARKREPACALTSERERKSVRAHARQREREREREKESERDTIIESEKESEQASERASERMSEQQRRTQKDRDRETYTPLHFAFPLSPPNLFQSPQRCKSASRTQN